MRLQIKVNELNEMYLLRSRVFFESDQHKKGIRFIEKNSKYMVDDFTITRFDFKRFDPSVLFKARVNDEVFVANRTLNNRPRY